MTEQSDVPQGAPVVSGNALVDLMSADPPTAYRSVAGQILEERLAAPRVPHRTKVEQWVEEPWTLRGGRWVEVED